MKTQLQLTELAIDEGNLSEARTHLEEALSHADAPSAQLWRPFQLLVETRLAIAEGRAAIAAARLADLFDGYDWTAPADGYHRAHELAADFYAARGDYPEAYRHAAAFAAIDGRINGAAAANSFNLVNAEFEASNRDLLIERLRSEQLRAEVEAAHQKARLRAVVSLAVILGFIGVLAFVAWHLRTVGRASRRLAATNEKLVTANETKTRFLANTSHEIRTPLNAIMGMSEVLLSDDAPLDDTQRERLTTIRRSGEFLLAIVTDILDVAKMEQGGIEPVLVPTDVSALARRVVDAHEGNAARCGIDLSLTAEASLPHFSTDARLIEQALGNLVGNAVKFTDEGEVAVALRHGEAGFVIEVRDTGIGIKAERLGEVFDSFRQVDDGADRRFGGTGLGLAIVRNIAEVLGGTVAVRSAPGTGSVFTLSIPARPAETAPSVPTGSLPSQTASDALRGLDVLLAEDNVVNVQVVRALIGKDVGSITVAEDGAAAVEHARLCRYDVVLMDNQMPEMSGGEATRAIRRLTGYDEVPIIGVTGDVAPAVREELMSAGMDLIVAKPVKRTALIEAITAAVDGTLGGGDADVVAARVG